MDFEELQSDLPDRGDHPQSRGERATPADGNRVATMEANG